METVVTESQQTVVDNNTCPVCQIPLRRSNCGRGDMCHHNRPMEVPCAQCKSEQNNRIYWNCKQCGFLKADVPPVKDWRISLQPRVDGEFVEELPEE